MPQSDQGQVATFSGPDAPAESDLYKCVHCGFCLQACPTYVETGLETESPRGRIALMKAVNEGRISIGPTVTDHWDLCIQCRACEVACPSGVPYGKLIEATMAQVERQRKPSVIARAASGLLLRGILPHQGRLALLVKAMRMYRGLGLQAAVRKTGALRHRVEGASPSWRVRPRRSLSRSFEVEGPGDPRRRRAQGEGRAAVGVHHAVGARAADGRGDARAGPQRVRGGRGRRARPAAARSTPTWATWRRLASLRGATWTRSWASPWTLSSSRRPVAARG